MNREAFIQRWRSMGTTRQLAILLAALVKREQNGEVSLSMDDLDNVEAGQTVIYREIGDKILLQFNADFATFYTIDEQVHQRGNQWPTPTVSGHYSNSQPMKTDEELAEMEDRVTAQGRLREAARRARVEPLTTTERKPGTPHRRPASPAEELQ